MRQFNVCYGYGVVKKMRNKMRNKKKMFKINDLHHFCYAVTLVTQILCFAKMRFYIDFVQVLRSSTLQTEAKSKLINIEYERAL